MKFINLWTVTILFIQAFCVESVVAASESHGSTFLRAIISAKSASELENIVDRDHQMDRLRLQCESQLRSQEPPLYCLELLQFENRENTTQKAQRSIRNWSSSEWPEKEQIETEWLDKLCGTRVIKLSSLEKTLQIAQKLKSSRDKREALQMPQCWQAIGQRINDLVYLEETQNPDRVFRMQRIHGPTFYGFLNSSKSTHRY